MSQELTITEQQKAQNWALFGTQVRAAEITHKQALEKLMADYPLPTDINKIEEYDQQLKKLKEGRTIIVESVKAYTDKIDALRDRVYSPSKGAIAYLAQFEGALLPLKQEKARKAQAAEAERQALLVFKHEQEGQKVQHEQNCLQCIVTMCNDLYIRALNSSTTEITTGITDGMVAKLPEWVLAGKGLTIDEPKRQAIYDEVWKDFDPKIYIDKFRTALRERFATFAFDKANAKEAIQLAEADKVQATAQAAQIIAQKEAISSIVTAGELNAVTVQVEGLKTEWSLDNMPMTDENKLAVLTGLISTGAYKEIKSKAAFDTLTGYLEKYKNKFPNDEKLNALPWGRKDKLK